LTEKKRSASLLGEARILVHIQEEQRNEALESENEKRQRKADFRVKRPSPLDRWMRIGSVFAEIPKADGMGEERSNPSVL